MNTEDLMKPRYKVIADYPNASWVLGEIIEDCPEFVYSEEERARLFEQYPHLFKKLEWWEDRKPEDMPQYLKYTYDKKIIICKVERYYINSIGQHCYMPSLSELGGMLLDRPSVFPATEQEYNEWLNKETKVQ